MYSLSSHPLPHLPLETQAAILRFCDVSTLAVSSRVSLAWLELAGPLLYEHITIRGKQKLGLLIRSEVGLASIAPFVSLNQARTFTYVLPESAEMNGDSEDVTQRLSLSTGQLEDLVIDLRQAPPRIREIELPNLLASFDFGHLHVTSLPTLPKSCFTLPSHLKLSRLRQITLTHALNNQPLIQIAPIVARSPCINLVYDLVRSPSTDSGERILSAICDDLCPQDLGAEGSSTAFGHVQLWLANEREVALAKEVLVDCSCTSLEIGVKLPLL